MHDPSISVVIPVHDTGLWTLDALDSVLEQTYPPAEILLVDDGSAAPTAALLDRAAARRPGLVRVLRHARSLGPGIARNTALGVATGDLIVFLDSDDALAGPGVLEEVARSHVASGWDMLRLRLRFWRQDPVSGAERFWDDANDGFIPADLTGVTAAQVPALYQARAFWQFAYRRAFLVDAGLGFEQELRRREDRPFLTAALLQAARVDLSATVGFHYRQRTGSIMHAPEAEDLEYFARGVELSRARIAAAGEALGPARFILEIHYLTGLYGLCAPFLEIGEEDAVRAMLARLRGALCTDLPPCHPGPGPEAAAAFARWAVLSRQSRFPPAASRALENGWLGRLHAALLEGEEAALDLLWAALSAGREAAASGAVDPARAAAEARAALAPPAAPVPTPPRAGAARRPLLLHIGLTKTGSTSLQGFWELNRARLRDRGVIYPETGIYREPGSDRGSGHNMGLRELFRPGPRPVFDTMLEEAMQGEAAILSCENLSWNADWRGPAGVESLARALEGFDVTVLMVVRDEFDWLVSMYKEAVVGGWLRFGDDPAAFLRMQEALGGLDFRGILGGFAARFGVDRCHALDLKGEGPLERRAMALLAPDLAQDDGLLIPPRANLGVSDASAAALRLLNRLPAGGAEERAFLSMVRTRLPAPETPEERIEAMLDALAALRAEAGRAGWSEAERTAAAARLQALWGSSDLRAASELVTERQRWARRPEPPATAETPTVEIRTECAEPIALTPLELMQDHAAGEEERRMRRFGAARPYGMTLSCDPVAGVARIESARPLDAVRLVWDALDRPETAETGEWISFDAPRSAVAIPIPRRRFAMHARLAVQARAGRRSFRRELLLAMEGGAPVAIVVGGAPEDASADRMEEPAPSALHAVRPARRGAAAG